MAPRRIAAHTAPPTQNNNARISASASGCPALPDCGVAFAEISANYSRLNDRMAQIEERFDEGFASIRQYLKEDYAQAIKYQIAAIAARLRRLEKTVARLKHEMSSISKKIVYATGGIAMLTFLIGIGVALIKHFWSVR